MQNAYNKQHGSKLPVVLATSAMQAMLQLLHSPKMEIIEN